MKITIAVAAHKKCEVPRGEIYLPVQAGAAGKESIGFQRDDEGENISAKNPYYSELTALYWLWKNCPSDYLGLVHYRRYFGTKKAPFSREDFEKELQKKPVLLPKKRNYYIETLYSHYAHTLHGGVLDLAGEIIAEKEPRYLPEFERLKKRRSAHMFNMIVARRDILDGYLSFLFPLLFELEKRVDEKEFSDPFHARFPGRISELLLDVYIRTEKIPYAELPVYFAGGENKCKKAAALLKAKFFGKKYEKSF